MKVLCEHELVCISGGNAQDTTTGSFGDRTFSQCLEAGIVAQGPNGSFGAAVWGCIIEKLF